MREIGTFTAKTHLSQILDSVSHGESFAITRHGKVIAFLVPAETKTDTNVTEAIHGIIALREKISHRRIKVTADEIKAMREAGRK